MVCGGEGGESMILSLHQIEEIGAAVIQDFNEFFFHDSSVQRSKSVRATPIDQFARDYLEVLPGYPRTEASAG